MLIYKHKLRFFADFCLVLPSLATLCKGLSLKQNNRRLLETPVKRELGWNPASAISKNRLPFGVNRRLPKFCYNPNFAKVFLATLAGNGM